jgi:hypothetical protein
MRHPFNLLLYKREHLLELLDLIGILFRELLFLMSFFDQPHELGL